MRFVVRLLGCSALAIILAGCGDSSMETSAEVVVEDPAAPTVALFEQPVPDDPDPARRAGAASNFIECDHGIWDGGWSGDFGPTSGALDAGAALLTFVSEGLFAIPRSGFVHTGTDQSRRLFTYAFDGKTKTAVIVADSADVSLDVEEGWAVETFASCDPAEFDPALDEELGFDIWLDADGSRVPIGTVRSAPGPEHCGWESTTFLTVEDNGYIRDPGGVLQGITEMAEFEDDSELPPDAIDTGYELGGRQLWLAADRSVAYIVESDKVEAWPSPREPFGCA